MKNNSTLKLMPKAALSAIRQLCMAVAVLAAALAPSSALAEETVQQYALKLKDVQVTSQNCSDIQFDQHRGKASYDPTTKTLTLDNIYATDDNQPVVHNMGIDGLTIKCKTAIIMEGDAGGFLIEANTTIEGSEAEPSWATFLRIGKNTKVTMTDFSKFTFKSEDASVSGVTGTEGETLVVRSSYLSARGRIEKLAALETDDCDIVDGSAFDATLHAVTRNGEVASDIDIYKYEEFDVWIAGVRVTTRNFNKLAEIPGVSGTILFGIGETSIYMDNCNITPAQGVAAIRSDMEDFAVVLMSGTESTLTANGAPAMILGKYTYIESNGSMYYGKLKATASGGYPAILASESLEIYSAELDASGKYGIEGDGDDAILWISEAKAHFAGSTAAMANISGVNTAMVKITSPTGAAYDSSLRGVAKDGKLVNDVTFDEMEDYGLDIGNYYVNEENCADLSVLPNITGNASYDHSTRTLTLDNATVDGCISSRSKDDFTILVKGKCSITGDLPMLAISLTDIVNATIKGEENSELWIDMPETSYTTTPITLNGTNCESTLTIDNCNIDIKGDMPLYCTRYIGELSTLRIVNSALNLHATSSPIYNFKAVEMKGSVVASPEGLHYKSPAFLDKDNIIYEGEMTIVRDTTNGIESLGTDDNTNNCIYNIGGAKIARSGGKLPKGIYITGGKKKAVR